ncbi:MAG TPA: HEPN domain-containing protein [Firmicutes bacterium]|nr:HEPN domain-containing protein [Bacillota bacterium]
MAQSEQTLRSAYVDAEHEFYNWSCFKAHQAGEYSIKAILQGIPSLLQLLARV